MYTRGIVRKVDELGRIVLPIEIRRTLGIEERDSLRICIEENEIVLRKNEPLCLFCGSNKDIRDFKTKTVCACCIQEMNNAE